MPEPTIPAEAVEAAAKAIASANLRSKSWDALNEEARNHFLRDARAALEAAAPHLLADTRTVTATVSTLAELDALPRFTVIRSDEGAVFERQTMWHEAGSRDLKYSPDIALPATVLQLGWGEA